MAALNNEVPGLRPAGHRFNPTDLDLVKDYLFYMVYGVPPLTTSDVLNIDVYGDGEWKEPFEVLEEDTLYFFTRLTPRRVVADGVWKNQHPPTYISDDDGAIIGSKLNFSFIPNEGVPEPRGKWVMYEYRLEGPYANNLYGLCRIRKKMGRVADYGPPDDEEMSQMGRNGMPAADANGPPDDEELSWMMMDLENILRGDGQI